MDWITIQVVTTLGGFSGDDMVNGLETWGVFVTFIQYIDFLLNYSKLEWHTIFKRALGHKY